MESESCMSDIRYVDSHAHIFSEEFREDFDAVINRIEESHIDRVIIICTRADEAREAMAFVKKNPERYQMAYGIHPEDVDLLSEEALKEVYDIVSDPLVSCVGEIGLDYYWEKEKKEAQKELFIRQIEIAREIDKPILVHSREAIQDTFDIMKEHRVKGVMHCFPGTKEMGMEFTKLGYYIALGGAVTFKNARHSKEVCAAVDPSFLLSETDCPYMAPVPLRGTRNEPSNIPYIVKVMADTRGITAAEMAEIIWNNYERLLHG